MLQKLILIVFGIGITFYLTICLLLRWKQTSFIFFPHSLIRSTPQDYNLAYQDIWLNIGQEKIHGWWIPASKPSAPVMLYFHGNGSNNGDLTHIAAFFNQLGLSVLLIDYRGYGRSSPTFPNETRVYEDAETAWNYLIKNRQIKPQNIFVYGHSLGGAIAIELASKHPEMAGLITEGTFTSIEDIASMNHFFRILPLNLILTQHFNSFSKIKSLKTPILILHGEQDKVIPYSMAKQLFAIAPEPKQLVIIPQAGHDNLLQVGGQQYFWHLLQFIQSNTY
jgi:uncharacterized protein